VLLRLLKVHVLYPIIQLRRHTRNDLATDQTFAGDAVAKLSRHVSDIVDLLILVILLQLHRPCLS
jgi:hypothetical protein